ncbi:guanylate cyclase 32E-like [Gigantopelta aegis]|uniref:guanylate cyclase 32E-like n=1 Tax=Gigantopelta aegis TaxID=1735272 RepID=UPI001B8882C7|nr:guanylate cyclase 32E-like [Gigantopelta aegis]
MSLVLGDKRDGRRPQPHPIGMFLRLDTVVGRILLYLFLFFTVYRWCECDVIRIGYITGSERHPGHNVSLYGRPGQAISGAITYAVHQINMNTTILPNHTLDFIIAETYGMENHSIKETVLLLDKNISVYIGPQESCVNEGRIAASFNVPMISYFCSETEVSDKNLYPTFARTKPTDSQISKNVVSILKMFNWTKVTFVYSSSEVYQHTAVAICDLLEYWGITVSFKKVYKGPYFHKHAENPFIKIVSETRTDTRIYVMLGAIYEFVGLMDHLHEIGLLDSGEYFVVGVHTGEYDPNNPQAFLEGIFQDEVTRRSVAAFRHFVGVVTSPPVKSEYSRFTEIVNAYLEAPPFNYTNPYKHLGAGKKIKHEASYLYDAVWLYAQAVDKILQEGGDINDGRAIFGKIKGHTYKSAMGYISRINDNGDAEGNFSLVARREMPSADGDWGMYPVGVFRLNTNLSILPTFHFYEGESIHWISGVPPLDEPVCGYRFERCIPRKTYTKEILGGVAGGILLIAIIAGQLIYRNWRYEQALASLLWKIDCKDLVFRNMYPSYNGPRTKKKKMMKKGSLYVCFSVNSLRCDNVLLITGYILNYISCCFSLFQCNSLCRSTSQISLTSQCELDLRQLFTHVGTYKGTIVAIRKVNKKSIELSREIRKELKIMRDMRHDNINTFVGACIDAPNIFIITAYCAKGSLQDILENEDMQLDSMFIASLIFDIVRGMIYLHESEIRSHGKLKSSNCVVDSRWVLKITDFGLHEFVSGAEDDLGEHALYRNMQWRAPELLRHKNPPARGTQEGDVYSFAIIMFEIHCRKGPFGNIDLSPKEIIERVRTCPDDVPFRPHLSELSSTPAFIIDIIKECWDEDPLKRPIFKVIRTKLKPMQKGMKSNIFDNMLAIMEKYADNLEALVEDRTDQLIEEKKKTEELLYQMLPRPVAEQLMIGKKVEAEAYDSVTIYFSDICGFTQMSSESTPMQVIDLLNDLYTLFDSTIEFYDVYKVETIGDAYMVVSGLPNRNGIAHAGEIASMSIHLLESIKRFRIRHRPTDTLSLRIGIHSGSCVAGVVGLKMPRYCLFGDTVNTASRMESSGSALKVHCSNKCKDMLEKIGGYQLEERGFIPLKGKGEMQTFWLVGEDEGKRVERFRGYSPSMGMTSMSSVSSFKRRSKGSIKLNHAFVKNSSGSPIQEKTVPNGTTTGVTTPLFLHPHGFLSGPSSADLLRRSSSRRRRLKFTVSESEDDRCSQSEVDFPKSPVSVMETTPLISRRFDEGEEVVCYPSCTSPV